MTFAALSAVLALAGLAPGAASARRLVPAPFFAMNFDHAVASTSTPEKVQDQQLGRIAQAGAESVRVDFFWANAQPDGPGSVDFTATDRIVRLAAKHGLGVLPVVISSPRWARAFDGFYSPPRNANDYAVYIRKLIRRYGAHGSFWAENRGLRKLAIRAWQIWNEPHLNYQWRVDGHEHWAGRYAQLLRTSYKVIKREDKKALVVLAGLANNSPKLLDHLYHYDVRRAFDVAAIHPYTSSASGVLYLTRQSRKVMRAHGDGNKAIWMTEVGLPASKGKVDSKQSMQTTDRGMAAFLKTVYRQLAAGYNDPAMRVRRAYWYTWATPYPPPPAQRIFDFAGLFAWSGGKFFSKPAYGEYIRSARHYEGCVKDATARCVR